jgi:hypothetical protein
MLACSPASKPSDQLKSPSAQDAFGGVECAAVRPQTEPDLMAWDSGSRANLNRLRRRGLVAVRYEAKGCNVQLELLSSCIGPASKYEFSPYSANERKLARNANDLYAQLPVGAASVSGALKGNRVLRTDYMLAGQYAVPPDAVFRRADLSGPDCARATHVITALYVGAFAMGAGESRSVEASATLLGAGGGAKTSTDLEVLRSEGDADACASSQRESKESDRCSVPLRIGLAALDGGESAQANCRTGERWDGTRCVGADPSCPAGQRFEQGRGCVASPTEPPATFEEAMRRSGNRPANQPGAGTASFDDAAAGAALEDIAAKLGSCKKGGGPTGTGVADITFGPDGTAKEVAITEGPFKGTPSGGCIAGKFRGARVPAFSGSPVHVKKRFSL